MANCAVCGEEARNWMWYVDLCDHHYMTLCKWFTRWSISTGHTGPINITSAKIINLLKNIDVITRSKRAKV